MPIHNHSAVKWAIGEEMKLNFFVSYFTFGSNEIVLQNSPFVLGIAALIFVSRLPQRLNIVLLLDLAELTTNTWRWVCIGCCE